MSNDRSKNIIPVKDGLWEDFNGDIYLVGDRCTSCGELFFPQKFIKICAHCHCRDLEKVRFSKEGRIINVTVVYQQPAGGFYFGPVPYAYGVVELPEKVRILTLFSSSDLESLEVGMRVILTIEKLFDDAEGNEIITYKFKPIGG
jgi:uncharacterized OB-fold protein